MLCSSTSIDITPKSEVKLCGYINDVRNSQTTLLAHSPIYANCLRLEYEDSQLVFITLDILSIPGAEADAIKKEIASIYPVHKDEIHISAIHTHSGPNGVSVDAMGKPYDSNELYRKQMGKDIVQGIKPLFENGKEAKAYLGKTHIDGYYDNRNDSNRYYENEAVMIRFEAEDGGLLGIWGNISVHSTVLGPFNMEISYDLLGTVREKIFEKEGVRPLMTLGTAADVSNRHCRKGDDFIELERVAQGIADKLLSIKTYKEIDMSSLSVNCSDYHLAYDNRVNFEYYRKELSVIEEQLENTDDKVKVKLLLSSKDKYNKKLNIEFVDKHIVSSIIRFPDLTVVTWPGELTSIFGREIKDALKMDGFVVSCCDDHHGYFIESDLYGKCYESTATLIPQGETEKIVDFVKENL